MKSITRLKVLISPRWQKTEQPGVYAIDHRDGSRTYLATWEEQQPINITDPLTTRRRKMEKAADTFEEACRIREAGVRAELKRQHKYPESRPRRIAERFMAAKWFEYWVRR